MGEFPKTRVAILASGSGSTAEAFIRATQNPLTSKWVNAEVGLVVCNNKPEKAGIYDRIARLNEEFGLCIKTEHISSATHPGDKTGPGEMTMDESVAICNLMSQNKIDHIALMGFMKKVSGLVLDMYGYHKGANKYETRMSNTHPGPLPETKGTFGVHASERVLELGMKASRITMHLVSANYDEGPIIAEHEVRVPVDCDAQGLFDRVQVIEKLMLPIALGDFFREQREYRKRLAA
jgi:phosphoribosylglycinamide formyltransferase 1